MGLRGWIGGAYEDFVASDDAVPPLLLPPPDLLTFAEAVRCTAGLDAAAAADPAEPAELAGARVDWLPLAVGAAAAAAVAAPTVFALAMRFSTRANTSSMYCTRSAEDQSRTTNERGEHRTT